MSEVRYFMPDGWKSKSDIARGIVEAYQQWEGRTPTQQEIDKLVDQNIEHYESGGMWGGVGQDEEIPMSFLEGGEGDDTLLGGGDHTLQGYRGVLPSMEYRMGGKRTLPLSDKLSPILQAAAAAAGVDALRVVSGGQGAKGTVPRSQRTGSVRHDHGNAADFKLIIGDRVLNFEDPNDRPVFEKFMQTAVALGAQGVGAGKYYMGPETIHVGFGNPVAWGAGGSSALAPQWLKNAWRAGIDNPLDVETALSSAPQTQTVQTDTPALGARAASDLDTPPSWPSPQEATRMLAERGYTGPDAVTAFQANELLNTHPSGSMDSETVAALMNPNPITPPERPNVVAGSSGMDTLQSGRPDTLVGGIQSPPEAEGPPLPNLRPMPPVPPPAEPSAGLGAVAPQAAPTGLPTPPARPAGLGAAGQELPGDYRRLRVGDQGEDVMRVQSQLSAAGFNPGPLDGRYGPKTAAAVMDFQRTDPERVGGKVDAIAGPWTQSALHNVTQNSALSSLRDPGGVPKGSPTGLDMARTLGRSPSTETAAFDPGGGTGRDSRPPGTVPAGAPVTRSNPLTSKPWSGIGQFVKQGAPLDKATMDAIKQDGAVGITVAPEPSGLNRPSPLSPVSVIAGMGGTGSSGLGPAGTGGPGPGSGFGPGSGSGMMDDDEETSSGYNESFSTTGWL